MLKWPIIFFFAILLYSHTGNTQSWNSGLNFQGVMEDSGALLTNHPIALRFTIVDEFSAVLWQETTNLTTNDFGVFKTVIGAGMSTGAGSAVNFSEIDFSIGITKLKIEVDADSGGYLLFQNSELLGVPFSEHSYYNQEEKMLNVNLYDLDSSGLALDHVIVWNGSNWDVLTTKGGLSANYSSLSFSSAASGNALYANSSSHSTFTDSAFFTSYLDTAAYSLVSTHSETSTGSSNSNSASYAQGHNGVSLAGNVINTSMFIGTLNPTSISFFTNNLNRLKLNENGGFLQGVSDSTHSMLIKGVDGFQVKGTLGSGDFSSLNNGSHFYFSPKYSSMWLGTTFDTLWHESNAKNYNFVFGRNSWINGSTSAVFGDSCVVTPITGVTLSPGIWSLALGKKCAASGAYSFSCGYNSYAKTNRSVALGYLCTAPYGYSCVAMGHSVIAHGNITPVVAIGHNINNNGQYSLTLGHNIDVKSRKGSFLYSDFSTNDTLSPPSIDDNQFLVRAAGGTIIYSDSGLLSGVQLFSGGGSWSTVSDYHKKEQFRQFNENEISNQISKLKIFSWNYQSQDDHISHVGPMAQDFSTLFNYGINNTSISTIDPDGITMRGIQEVDFKLNTLNAQVIQFKDNADLNFEDARLRLNIIEAILNDLDNE